VARITAVETFDVRFPTSRQLDGSDAMNPDPDCSAAYVIVRTDVDRLVGHGFAFTIGRGNEIQRPSGAAWAEEVATASITIGSG
jgi:L-fuconate dehydratase